MSSNLILAMPVPGIFQLLLVLVIVLVLFGGRGKLSSLMGDLAQGIQSFRKGLKDGGEDEARAGGAIPDTSKSERQAETPRAETPRTEA